MADNILFEINASQILAKLHLAGLQAVSKFRNNTSFIIINTGINHDDINAKPDNPKKVTFDLNNSSGEYELGVILDIEYRREFNNSSINDIKQNSIKKQILELERIINTIVNNKIDSKNDAKQIKRKKELTKEIFKTLKINSKTQIDTPADVKKIKNVLKKRNKNNTTDNQSIMSDQYATLIESNRELAFLILQQYMTVFAGSKQSEKISNDNIAIIEISPHIKDSNDESLVKMFEIVPISNVEQEKLIAQFQAAYKKDPTSEKPNCKQKVCYKIKYDLTVDK